MCCAMYVFMYVMFVLFVSQQLLQIFKATVLPAKSDSDTMFCLQGYRDLPFRIWYSSSGSAENKETCSVQVNVKRIVSNCKQIITQLCDQSKKDGKDQESTQSITTPDTGYQWESNKLTIRHHKREPNCQTFPSRWPQGINKQTCTKT